MVKPTAKSNLGHNRRFDKKYRLSFFNELFTYLFFARLVIRNKESAATVDFTFMFRYTSRSLFENESTFNVFMCNFRDCALLAHIIFLQCAGGMYNYLSEMNVITVSFSFLGALSHDIGLLSIRMHITSWL